MVQTRAAQVIVFSIVLITASLILLNIQFNEKPIINNSRTSLWRQIYTSLILFKNIKLDIGIKKKKILSTKLENILILYFINDLKN